MNIEPNEGYYLTYAKSGGIAKNTFFNERKEVIEFFIENLNNIDLLTINGAIIDKNKLINNNILLSRYLKLKKIEEII